MAIREDCCHQAETARDSSTARGAPHTAGVGRRLIETPVTASSIRVLLVDEDLGDVPLVQGYMRDGFAELRGAGTLAAALEAVSVASFDLALLDLELPDSTGIATYERLAEAAPILPIIVLTDNHDIQTALRTVRLGAQDYLVKSEINGPLLQRSIDYAIERMRSRVHAERRIAILDLSRNLTRDIGREQSERAIAWHACEMLVASGAYENAWLAFTRRCDQARRFAVASSPAGSHERHGHSGDGLLCPCNRMTHTPEGVAPIVSAIDHAKTCPLLGGSGRSTQYLAVELACGQFEFGVLCVGLPPGIRADQEEQALLSELAGDTAFVFRARELAEQRHHAEFALRQRERELAVLYDNAPVMMLLLDAELQVRKANALADTNDLVTTKTGSMAPLGGVLGCANVAADSSACGTTPACTRCRIRQLARRSLKTGEAHRQVDAEFWRYEDGVRKMAYYSVSTATLTIDAATSVLVALQDATERKRMETTLAQSDRLASMGMLAAGVAHEMNNPLSYVLYNLQTLCEDLPPLVQAINLMRQSVDPSRLAELPVDAARVIAPEELGDLVDRTQHAEDGARRLKDIVKQLGTFARVEEERIIPVSLNTTIDVALRMAANEIKYRARLVKEYGPLPELSANDGKLAQVFLNLVVNAAQSIDEGNAASNEIRVRTWHGGGSVFAEIADTGQGIPPEQIPRLFDPFFTTKRPGLGSGLGLAICRNIIASMKGEITVDSTPGVGSRFLVRLPVGSRINGNAPRLKESPHEAGTRGRFLIVDDEPQIVQSLQRVLEQDHDVITTTSGAEALRFLEQSPRLDGIICDLMMPEVTGMDLHEWLHERDPALAQRIIFITGGPFTARAQQFVREIKNPRFETPIEAQQLKSRLRLMVSNSNSARSA